MDTKTSDLKKKEVKHGITLWTRAGKISPSVRGYKRLRRYIHTIEQELIEMQGGAAELTTAREILIKSTIEAYGVILLVSMYCKREGIIRPDQLKKGIIELQPVLGQQTLSYINTIRQNLIALGLDRRRIDKVLDLGRYISERDQEAKAEAAGKAGAQVQPDQVNRQGGGGDVQDKAQDAGGIEAPASTSSDIPGQAGPGTREG